jgi:hypothetical protein
LEYVYSYPASSVATQKVLVGHDSATRLSFRLGAISLPLDQVPAEYVYTLPWLSPATQRTLVAQEIAVSSPWSLMCVPVDQVPSEYVYPVVPPTAAQKLVVGHETNAAPTCLPGDQRPSVNVYEV